MLKNNAESRKICREGDQADATALQKRAAEDAVEDANLFAILVRRQFEKSMPASKPEASAHFQCKGKTVMPGGSQDEDEVDGVLIHPVEGSTQLILSDELLQISLATEVESIKSEPIRLFHVQSRTPWMQQVCSGSA